MKFYWLLTAGLTALATPCAYAQDSTAPAADAESVPTDGEIVVTASGRSQPLQDVPIAVQAVSAATLQNSGANDIRQLNQVAPSLFVSSTSGSANTSARIRGIGTVGDNPGLESSVAVFVDGVYRPRNGAALNELGEVERIEVLRGPQGTLFGRNASAGLIHVVTKKPEFEFGGKAEATYGNHDFYRLSAGVTGPISEQLAFRIDGVYSKRDGFLNVINEAKGVEKDVNDLNRYLLRGQLLFEPNDNLSFRLIGDYSRRNESCCGAVYLNTDQYNAIEPDTPDAFKQEKDPGGRGYYKADFNFVRAVMEGREEDNFKGLGAIFPDKPYDRDIAISDNRSYKSVTRDWGLSGELNWNLGAAKLTSVTAYRNYRAGLTGDIDFSNLDILFRPGKNDGDTIGENYRSIKTFSQEIRLQGESFEGKLDWLIGGYFAKENIFLRERQKFGKDYGRFAACRAVSAISTIGFGDYDYLTDVNAKGCLSAKGIIAADYLIDPGLRPVLTALTNQEGKEWGDIRADYRTKSTNWALFTHNIINITDRLSLTLGLRYTKEKKKFSADLASDNPVCVMAQDSLFGALTTGSDSAKRSAPGVVQLACLGNSSSDLNDRTFRDKRSEDEFTGTAVLSYKPTDDSLIYASYARGYKAGGFNMDRSALGNPLFRPEAKGANGEPLNIGPRGEPYGTANMQFDPETVNAYEVGFKFTQPKFFLNAAIFHQEFKNFQLNSFSGTSYFVQNINSCGADLGTVDYPINTPDGPRNMSVPADSDRSASTGACTGKVKAGVLSTGVELEAGLSPTRHLTFAAGLTYANTRYRHDLIGRDNGQPLDPSLFLLPGNNLSNAPRWTVTNSITWTPPIGSSGLSGLFYVDQRTMSDFNTGSDLWPRKAQEGFTLVNARIGVRGSNWALEAWSQNLLNKKYVQVAFNTPAQGTGTPEGIVSPGGFFPGDKANQMISGFLGEPRTFGLTGRFNF